MGFIKNIFNFILHPTSSRTTGILIILVLAAAVPLTVIVSKQQQELRQHAASTQQVSVPTQTCIPPSESVFRDIGFPTCDKSRTDSLNQNDYRIEMVAPESPNHQGICTNSPEYYVYKKGKSGKSCNATDPTSGSPFSGTCNDQGSCVGTITPLPTPKPPIVGDYSTPTPIPSSQRCDSPNGSVRTDGANQYVCSSQQPPDGSCYKPATGFSCVNPSDKCYVCSTTNTAQTVPSLTPTPTAIQCTDISCNGNACNTDQRCALENNPYPCSCVAKTATAVPAVPANQTAPPPTASPNCPLKSKGDADCDGKVNILDYNILRDEFTDKLQTRTADFNSNNVIDNLDLGIWKNSMQDSNIRHY